MQKVRVIATGLFYLSRIIALPYLLTAAYALISIVFKTPAFSLFDGGKRFVINYPFTSNRFLIGDDYSFGYILDMIAFMGLYGLFFWLLSNVFKTFREQKLFTPKGVKRLTIFYLFNFLTPLPFLVMHMIQGYEVGSVVVITILHAVLGVFAYFMAVIFSRGLHLQNEQDLIF
jgi:hypothetical protein